MPERTATQVHLSTSPLVALGEASCLWFPWTGTRIQRTLCLLAECVGLSAADQGIAIAFEHGIGKVLSKLPSALDNDIDALTLAVTVHGMKTGRA